MIREDVEHVVRLTSAKQPSFGVWLLGLLTLFGGSIVGLAERGVAQLPPQVRHSTHDFTNPASGLSGNTGLKEVWVDSKSPGDGFTYSVGTIEVERSIIGPGQLVSFSGFDIEPIVPLVGFTQVSVTPPTRRKNR
jgi:hypothetical protein